ncbi:hypothetical protein EHQ82_01735 [Leptospira selangorensis]|uniref:Outer membrane protein beta-barrel domain-containing protein n=1 Tax=Leptospira selangorensis TaxID=2484982 RepID=A0ABY2NHN0_9LEPT|nr:hypothetical protein [Leptospira selangorensis]TGM27914.1 hypothetical protein EHQ82_01735 [Leptospira selangorensis]
MNPSAALIVVAILLTSSVSLGQDFIGEFLAPPGPAKTTVRLIATDSFENHSAGTDTPVSEQRVLVYVPFYEKENEVYGVNLKWDHLRLATDQKLNTGGNVPQNFYDAMLGGTYKRILDGNDAIAVNLSFGSASDDPFASGGSSTLSSTVNLTHTTSETTRWIYFLNYSNNRTFANNIPIPGFAYIYTPSKEFIGVFGLPFVFVRKAFTEEISASVFWLIYNFKTEVSYRIKGPIQAYASFGNSMQSFFREDRLRDDDRIFYNELKTLVGIKSPIAQSVFADLYLGRITNRNMYESEEFKLNQKDKISFESRYMMGLTLSGRF